MIIIVMGVAGSGKTTVGRALAAALGWPFVEGDELHPAANIRKMSRGEPLNDEDRRPWLAALRAEIDRRLGAQEPAVIACSALKSAYRSVLRSGVEDRVRVVYLCADEALLRERLGARRGHFFPASLLQSQLKTLEPPVGEPGVVEVNAAAPAEESVQRARAALKV